MVPPPSPSPVACFREGSKILCLVNNKEVYIPIENIRKGTLVKTSNNSNYKPVELIGYSIIDNNYHHHVNIPVRNETYNLLPESVLYICKKENYPELTEDLIITENHSILVKQLTELQKEKTLKKLGNIYTTDNKYRLLASIDERAEPWNVSGKHTIWHIALQNNNIYKNYGIYANGGLLVESISIRYLREKANMTLV